jgi:hypothetical protein
MGRTSACVNLMTPNLQTTSRRGPEDQTRSYDRLDVKPVK